MDGVGLVHLLLNAFTGKKCRATNRPRILHDLIEERAHRLDRWGRLRLHPLSETPQTVYDLPSSPCFEPFVSPS